MELSLTESGDVHILHISASLNGQTAPVAQAALNDLLDQGATKVLINCGRLASISSAGLRVLLTAAKRLQQIQGELRICDPRPAVMEVFRISGFHNVVPISGTEAEALAGF